MKRADFDGANADAHNGKAKASADVNFIICNTQMKDIS